MDKRQPGYTQQKVQPEMLAPLINNTMQKILDINQFLTETLMIKEYYNLIEEQAKLAASNKK